MADETQPMYTFGTPTKTEQPKEAEAAPSGKTQFTFGTPSEVKTGKTEEPTGDMGWGETLTQAASNVPHSAYQTFVEPVVNYEQTLEGLKQLGKGAYSKAAGVFVDQDKAQKAKDEAVINALGQHYADTYGSMEGFKKELAKNPLSILSDASMFLTGGGSLAGKLPSIAGEAGALAATAGKAIDPLSIAAQVPKAIGKGVTSAVNIPAHIQSGSAFESLQKAYDAGLAKDPVFWNHYSGAADANDLIDRVTGAIGDVAKERSANYVAGMDPIKASVGLDYQPVIDAITNARGAQGKGIGAFHGQRVNRGAQAVLDDIENTVGNWMSKPQGHPNHTIEGFDQLKRAIGDYYKDARGNSEAKKVVDDAYNAVKKSIIDVDPVYENIMDQYSQATQKLNDINSLTRGRSTQTQLNKILKTYKTGDKSNILSDLYARDPQLTSAIAGHDLSQLMPQGLRGIATSSLLYGGMGSFMGMLHPATLSHVALGSPKLMGGLNYGLGRAAGMPEAAVNKLPYFTHMTPYAASQIEQADRAGRKSGGRVSHETKADQLIAAAESAKKMHGRRTEALLDQPDEAITKALAVAKQNI